jgi:DNA-directed RNA polymerase subunit F
MEENYLTLAEIKELLDQEKAARGELSPEQNYALQHATLYARLSGEDGRALVKELMAVPMMSLANAYKIADLLPSHPDEVRAIFAKERFALGKEELDKVLELVGKHL